MRKQMREFFVLATFVGIVTVQSFAAEIPKKQIQKQDLNAIQSEISRLESGMQNAKQQEATLSADLQKLEKLLKLQALEIQLSTIELEKLGDQVQEMISRQVSLSQSIENRKKRIRNLLSILPTLDSQNSFARLMDDNRIYTLQYREVVSRLLREDREEILSLRKVLADVDSLNQKLQEEKERLAAHADDLKEQQEILTLNKNLKKDLLRKNHKEQSERLHAYQAAKSAESELESMLSKINIEAENRQKAEMLPASPVAKGSGFAAQRGHLPLPAAGSVVTPFGRKYDPATSLYTFHKGVDIRAGADAPVHAVYAGKIVYAGHIGGYGQLLILDHGDQFYSLVGQLGEVVKKEGDVVASGELIARTAADSTPLYFEIRQRHIAVNPVPWFFGK